MHIIDVNEDQRLRKLVNILSSGLELNLSEYGDPFLTEEDVSYFRKEIGSEGVSDKLVAKVITESKIDHLMASVTVPNSTERVSLVSFLISEIPVVEGEEVPETQGALQKRYSLEEQVSILKKSFPRPGIGISIATPDKMLLVRIASIVTSSQESMDVWVSDWLEQIRKKKSQTTLLGMLKAFSGSKNTSLEKTFFALPVIMPYVAIVANEKYNKSVDQRRAGTLYELGSNEYSDFSYNSRDDFLRRNIVNGLQVLEGKDLEDFVLNEIGRRPIDDKNVGVCAALLASSPKWDRELIDIEELMSVRDRFYNFGAVSSMISNHMLSAPKDWLSMAGEKPHCATLVSQVGQHDRFAKWLGRHSQSTQWGSLSYLKDLSGWIGIMDYENKTKTLNLLLDKFTNGMSTKSLYGSGIFYGKVLLSAFPEDPYVEQAIREQVGYLVKRALIDGDMELLKATADKKWITPDRIAECIWSHEEYKKLTGESGLNEELIRPFMPGSIKRKSLSEDLGL